MVGRDDELESFDLLLARIEAGRTEQSMIITGLRGVGKTVLPRPVPHQGPRPRLGRGRTAKSARTTLDRVPARHRYSASALPCSSSPRRPSGLTASSMRQLSSSPSPSASTLPEPGQRASTSTPPKGFADHGNLTLDLTDVLLALGEAAAERDGGVVLLFDEVQFLSKQQLEAVIEAMHKIGAAQTPDHDGRCWTAPDRRAGWRRKILRGAAVQVPAIGVLLPEDAQESTGRRPALDRRSAITRTKHWTRPSRSPEATHTSCRNSGTPSGRSQTDQPSAATMSSMQCPGTRPNSTRRSSGSGSIGQPSCSAPICAPWPNWAPNPQKASVVAAAMGPERTLREPRAPTRAELINMGLLYTPAHGYAGFTVPHFDRFMLRAIPELVVPPLKRRQPRKKDD